MKKGSNVVPETPERLNLGRGSSRRSSRRSHNGGCLNGEWVQVINETLPEEGLNESRGVCGRIEESPSGPIVKGLQERAQEILSSLQGNSKAARRSVPGGGHDESPFVIRKKGIPSPTSEQTFIEFVAGTQEMASTRIQSPTTEEKVKKWLLQGNQFPSPRTILNSPRGERRKSHLNKSDKTSSPSKNCEIKENKETSSSTTSSPIYKDSSCIILQGVVAFVDVHSDLVECVESRLKGSGASISPVLNNKVTHLIFKDGSLARYNKAKKLGLHIVSVSWIEACKREGAKVDESEYPSVSKDKYDSPSTALLLKRQKTRKRLMNLSTEEKYKRYAAKMRRKREKEELNSGGKRSLSPVKLVPLDFYNSPKYNEPRSTKSPKQKSVLDQIIECDDGEFQFLKTPPSSARRNSQGSPSCASILGDDFDTPLSLRVAKQFYANKRRSIVNAVTETGASPILEKNPPPKNEEILAQKTKRKVPEKEENPNPLLKPKTQKKKCLLFSQGHHQPLSETPSPSGSADISIRPPVLKKAFVHTQPLDSPVPINENSARFKKSEGYRSSRRSSMDFVRHINALNRREEISQRGRREIVCSSASTDDMIIIQQIIPQFGFYLSKSVSSRTTHVICCSEGATRRTLNVLRGLLRGCWIVSKDWILSSLEEGYLLDEEPYERTDFSPAVQACRLERIAFGSYRSSLLSEVGSIYVSRKSSFSTKDIGDLIRLAGGRISSTHEKADVVIGEASPPLSKTIGVKECWLMDTIQHNVVLPLDDYFLNS